MQCVFVDVGYLVGLNSADDAPGRQTRIVLRPNSNTTVTPSGEKHWENIAHISLKKHTWLLLITQEDAERQL